MKAQFILLEMFLNGKWDGYTECDNSKEAVAIAKGYKAFGYTFHARIFFTKP